MIKDSTTENTNLPAGWLLRDLLEVVFLQEGPGIRKYEYEDGGFPMINVRCVQDGYIDMAKSKSASMKLATTKWKHFQVDEGDILFTISGTIGRSAIVKKSDLPLLMNTSVVRFKSISNDLNTNFLYHYVSSSLFIDKLKNMSTGTAIQNVGPSHLKKMKVPIPPLPQQKQIVSILDKAFAAIDRAKVNAEKNLQNAKELFESYLQNVFENKGDDWEEVLIGEVSELIDSLHQTPKYSDSGYAMVRVTEIKGGYLKTEKALRVNESVYNEFSKRHKPENGDIIMSRVGASFGVCAFVHNNELFCLGQNTVFIIPKINPKLMFYFLKSPVAREQMNNLASGSAQPTISLKSIKAIEMNLPPVEMQQEIVQKIDISSDKCKKLESIYTQKLADLEEMKKSILQKAFSGQLSTIN